LIIDTSAIMAILFEEIDALHFTTLIANADQCFVSAGSWIELGAVITRRNPDLSASLAALERKSELQIAAVTAEQARIGYDAYRRFGRGTGHPANLKFGDCFAYALSRATGEPLLFKGEDFAQTDVLAAL
jgi:ribonuclease VapC